MPKLIWGSNGERFYEAGVDRGVLYVPGIAGVAWNGLKAINEAPSGGEPTPFYADGIKYANVSAAEEFNASLDAFSAPAEFGVCDGSVQIAAGLFITQQPRKLFGLSYRTMVGNDLVGLTRGYKIHLVYNALASAASRAYNTMSDSMDALELSWEITTTPPSAAFGFKPTAHFVVDSRTTPRGLLKYLEDMLYGTDTISASMISMADLIALFKNPGPNIATNLVLNPSFKNTLGTLVVRTNLVPNPIPELVTGYTAATPVVVGVMSDGTPCVETTLSAAGTPYIFSASALGTFVAGEVYVLSAVIELPDQPDGWSVTFRAHSRANNIYYPSGAVGRLWSPGTVRISVVFTVPAGGVPVNDLDFSIVGPNSPIGYRVRMGQVVIEKTSVVGPFFSGKRAAAGDFTYNWTGPENASTSQQRGKAVVAVAASGYQAQTLNGKVLALFNNSPVYPPQVFPNGAVGDFYAVRATVTNLATVDRPFRLTIYDGSGYPATKTVTIPAGAMVEIDVPAAAAATNTMPRWFAYPASGPGLFHVHRMIASKVSGIGKSAPEYFDGNTAATIDTRYSWTGEVELSASQANSWEPF